MPAGLRRGLQLVQLGCSRWADRWPGEPLQRGEAVQATGSLSLSLSFFGGDTIWSGFKGNHKEPAILGFPYFRTNPTGLGFSYNLLAPLLRSRVWL